MKSKTLRFLSFGMGIALVAVLIGGQIPGILPFSPIMDKVRFQNTVEMGPLARSLRTWSDYSEWVNFIPAGGLTGNWYGAVSGAGAAFSTQAPTAVRIGIVIADTGTTNTGRAGFQIANTYAFLFGGGVYTYETDVYIPDLSTVTETYALYIGFGDTLAAEPTDGAYFKYTDAGANPNWYAVTASNSTRTTTDTTVAAVAATWTRLKVVVNSTGTSVAYYINGVNVANNTTNIPTAVNRYASAQFNIIKSVGTTARTLSVDWTSVHVDLNVSR